MSHEPLRAGNSAAAQPRVVVVILNTRRPADTLACLASLDANHYTNLHTIVLDVGGDPALAADIARLHPTAEVVPLMTNGGYAGNNNVGLRLSLERDARWIFVLNEDTLLAPDCIQQLVAQGETDAAIGLVGPTVYHADEPNVIQSAGGRLDRDWVAGHIAQNEVDSGQLTRPSEVAWLSGCAIMVRRAMVESVGLLDERFYIYWEETEWCLRARRQGWRVLHVPAARLWHKGVQRNYQPQPSVTYYSARNRLLLLSLYHAPLRARLRAWAESLRTLASWTLRRKWRQRRDHRLALQQGLVDYVFRRWGQRPEGGRPS